MTGKHMPEIKPSDSQESSGQDCGNGYPAGLEKVSVANQATASTAEIIRLIDMALHEDIGAGDITAEAVVPEDSFSRASLILKEPAVVAGLSVFEMVLRRCQSDLLFEPQVDDSQEVAQAPFCLARLKGRSRALLAGERTALNLVQRMCGIATFTARFVRLARPHGIEILDTRKTTPGLRLLEKWAVRLGGGTNHRLGLFDQILIKDNHRAIAGGVSAAVSLARRNRPGTSVEIEVNTLEELKEALALQVERVMLDNMSPGQVRQAVALAAGRTYVEVSGGVNLDNIGAYLIEGVNGISIGALTHSVKNIDISLEFED
jgi:nicotinate-nucleotide pyrophosphorylase (carboxylating)